MGHETYDKAFYQVMAQDDDYDPRNSKYIMPISEEEEVQRSTELARAQIERLEVLLESREVMDGSTQTFQHYEQVLAELRYEAREYKRTHARMRSDPAKQADQQVSDEPVPAAPSAPARIFTHARVRSAPSAPMPPSIGDVDLVDDKPLKVNKVREPMRHAGPGAKLAAEESKTLLGPPVHAPLISTNPGVAPSTALLRGARQLGRNTSNQQPMGHTNHLRQAQVAPSMTVPKRTNLATRNENPARRRPSSPPSTKLPPFAHKGPSTRPNFPMCGEQFVVEENTNELVVPTVKATGRVPGLNQAYVMHL